MKRQCWLSQGGISGYKLYLISFRSHLRIINMIIIVIDNYNVRVCVCGVKY